MYNFIFNQYINHNHKTNLQILQGYPAFEDDDEEEGKRRSLRIRTRKRDHLIEEEVGEEDSDRQEQVDENESNQSKEQSDGTAQDGCPIKKESKSVIDLEFFILDYLIHFCFYIQYSDDMYSRVKRLRRSTSHYTSYRTTISNVKRTRNSKRSRRSYVMSSDGNNFHLSQEKFSC